MAARGKRPGEDAPAVVDEALDSYRADFSDARWQEYLAIHHRRYRVLIALVLELIARLPKSEDGSGKILDVGPRFEVDILHRLLPGARVDTLGIDKGLFPPRGGERQVIFDLNDSDDASRCPSLGPYQLILMAEVLEHLYTPPSTVLGWVASLLEPGGYLLIQTPNAVALPHRARMLAGINPFQWLNGDRAYPGHIREYTVAELRREGRALGLEVVDLRTANYFDSKKLSNRLYQRLERIVPRTLRSGITVVYQAC